MFVSIFVKVRKIYKVILPKLHSVCSVTPSMKSFGMIKPIISIFIVIFDPYRFSATSNLALVYQSVD